MQPSPPCPLLFQLLFPALAWLAGRCSVPCQHPRKCHAASPGPHLCRVAHSLLRWQCSRESRKACSTRSTLPLVELQPMRPILRTWVEKGERFPAAPTFAAAPWHHLPASRAAGSRTQAPMRSRECARGGHAHVWAQVHLHSSLLAPI